jgi:hypothetical protein
LKHFRCLTLLGVSLFLISACSKMEPIGPSPQQVPPAGLSVQSLLQNQIQITSSTGTPLAKSEVLIGMGTEGRDPLIADQNGRITIPPYWTNLEHVTISAPGHIRATYLHQAPLPKIFSLNAIDARPSLEVKGVTTGFENYIIDKDGLMDFAVVFPLLNLADLLFFNESSVASLEFDHISILGQKVAVSSNVSLPLQKEKFGPLTFTVNKPTYRFKVNQTGSYKFIATRARASVSALRDNLTPAELMNQTTFGGGGIRPVTVTNMGAVVDIPANEIKFKPKFSVTAGTLPEGYVMMAAPLVAEGSLRYPSDIKSIKSQDTKSLAIPEQGPSELVTIISAPDPVLNRAASAALNKVPLTAQLRHLGLIKPPTVTRNQIQLQVPTAPSDVIPAGTYITKSQVTQMVVDGRTVEWVNRQWEIYSDKWETFIQLPNAPQTDATINRLEASFLAREPGELKMNSQDARSQIFEELTYLSRNAVELK